MLPRALGWDDVLINSSEFVVMLHMGTLAALLTDGGTAEGVIEHSSGTRWTASGMAYGNHHATNLGRHGTTPHMDDHRLTVDIRERLARQA